jgi:TetR/AcrR family tetracycline transcriptional repressor
MAAPPAPRPFPLTVDGIVDAACRVVERDGLGGLSMRKLGAELGADPMAVYHHVAGKRELLALVTARTLGRMPAPDEGAPWDARVRQWATRYWELVVAHRELTLAGLGDPAIAAGGLPSTAPLLAAIAASRLPAELVEPNAFVVVDVVHGSALAVGSPGRDDSDLDPLRAAFAIGLDTIIAGIASLARRRPGGS